MYVFMKWLVPTLENFPRSQKFLIADRIQTAGLDVIDLLVEATYSSARGTTLVKANLRLDQMRLLLRLSHDLKLIDHRRFEFAAKELIGVGRAVGVWLKQPN
jgi:hypothetical protein